MSDIIYFCAKKDIGSAYKEITKLPVELKLSANTETMYNFNREDVLKSQYVICHISYIGGIA